MTKLFEEKIKLILEKITADVKPETMVHLTQSINTLMHTMFDYDDYRRERSKEVLGKYKEMVQPTTQSVAPKVTAKSFFGLKY